MRPLRNEPKRPLKTMHASTSPGFALPDPVLNPFSHMMVVGETRASPFSEPRLRLGSAARKEAAGALDTPHRMSVLPLTGWAQLAEGDQYRPDTDPPTPVFSAYASTPGPLGDPLHKRLLLSPSPTLNASELPWPSGTLSPAPKPLPAVSRHSLTGLPGLGRPVLSPGYVANEQRKALRTLGAQERAQRDLMETQEDRQWMAIVEVLNTRPSMAPTAEAQQLMGMLLVDQATSMLREEEYSRMEVEHNQKRGLAILWEAIYGMADAMQATRDPRLQDPGAVARRPPLEFVASALDLQNAAREPCTATELELRNARREEAVARLVREVVKTRQEVLEDEAQYRRWREERTKAYTEYKRVLRKRLMQFEKVYAKYEAMAEDLQRLRERQRLRATLQAQHAEQLRWRQQLANQQYQEAKVAAWDSAAMPYKRALADQEQKMRERILQFEKQERVALEPMAQKMQAMFEGATAMFEGASVVQTQEMKLRQKVLQEEFQAWNDIDYTDKVAKYLMQSLKSNQALAALEKQEGLARDEASATEEEVFFALKSQERRVRASLYPQATGSLVHAQSGAKTGLGRGS